MCKTACPGGCARKSMETSEGGPVCRPYGVARTGCGGSANPGAELEAHPSVPEFARRK